MSVVRVGFPQQNIIVDYTATNISYYTDVRWKCVANVYPSLHGNQTVSHHKHTHPHHITVTPLKTHTDSEPGVFECDINRINVSPDKVTGLKFNRISTSSKLIWHVHKVAVL